MPTEFDTFWASVPNKIAKGLARRTFAKLKKQGILPSLAELTKAYTLQAANYKASPKFKQEGWTYFPHPSTWLNNERWEDVVPVVKSVSHAAPTEGKYDNL